MHSNGWNQEEKKWRVIYKWKGPERIGVFLWLALHEGLLTNLQRAKRGMASSGECGRCRDGLETIELVLRGCFKATWIWIRILLEEMFTTFMNMRWEDWMLTNLTMEKLWQTCLGPLFLGCVAA